MNSERDENYTLICRKRGAVWQVEMRAGAPWSVGWFHADLVAAIQSAREKFAAEHPQFKVVFDGNPAVDSVVKPVPQQPIITNSTDLSDLFN